MVLNILLVTKKVKLLNHYVLLSGYIKYFEYGGMSILFLIKDDAEQEKYKQIWDFIKSKLGIKFHSLPVHDKKYFKTKVKEFDGVIKTNFLDNDLPKENKHYTCIGCITIDSVMRMDKFKMDKFKIMHKFT